LRKKQLGWRGEEEAPSSEGSSFVRIERASKESERGPRAVVRLGGCEWEFWDTSVDWLAGLMKELA
jgi:hypothetical protein